MSRLNTKSKSIKQQQPKIYFGIPKNDIETVDKLKIGLDDFIKTDLIASVNSYVINSSKFIDIKLNSKLPEKLFSKLSDKIFKIVDLPTIKRHYYIDDDNKFVKNSDIFNNNIEEGLNKLANLDL